MQVTGFLGLRQRVRGRATDAFSEIWESTLDTILRARLIERTADRLLTDGVVERVVSHAIEHPATERVVNRLLESPGFERLVLTVGQSKLFDELLNRVLASEQLDRVVAHIAESDEVRDALRQQSAGMADEVTGELRSRTIAADASLERFARSVIRRRRAPRDDGPPAAGGV
jgi:hypothetical protein